MRATGRAHAEQTRPVCLGGVDGAGGTTRPSEARQIPRQKMLLLAEIEQRRLGKAPDAQTKVGPQQARWCGR